MHYAPSGLIGVLTPQANTTVEPEFSILCPAGFAYLNARLTSDKETIEARLVDYAFSVEHQLQQFGNAPLDAIAFATTGASYLIGPEAEDELVARMLADRNIPLVTTALAVCDALAVLNARSVALVSPYPPDLTTKSVRYWEARGFEVESVSNQFNDRGEFHPIYAMDADSARRGLRPLASSKADALIMLGTGMPTLPVIASLGQAWPGPPVLSCMLALVWRAVHAAARTKGSCEDLHAWLSAQHWDSRLK